MIYNIGFVPNIYVDAVICDNREKRERSARRNFQRTVYEFAENNNMESFEVMLNDEIGKISRFTRSACGSS